VQAKAVVQASIEVLAKWKRLCKKFSIQDGQICKFGVFFVGFKCITAYTYAKQPGYA
jgi:hypothetical protein